MSHDKRNNHSRSGKGTRQTKRERKDGRTSERKDGAQFAAPTSSGIPSAHDAVWYNKFPTLVNNAANFWFSDPVGKTSRPYGYDAWADPLSFGGTKFEKAVPGIMTFSMVNCPGVCYSKSDPVNVVASALRNSVVYANSRNAPYEGPDLMQYVQVADSAYSYWAHLTRLYGTLNTYAFSNRYLGRDLVEAMGFNYDTLRGRSLELKSIIDNFAFQLGSLCIPKDFDMFSRHIWLYGNLFVDSVSSKAQIYLYKPEVVWLYDEMNSEKGGALIPHSIRCQSLEVIRDTVTQICENLTYAQSLMNMAADIRNAYGPENLFAVSTVDLNYQAPILYDERMMAELQNTVVLGKFNDLWETNRIYADVETQTLQFQPALEYDGDRKIAESRLVNWPTDDPTADDVMKITRNIAFGFHFNADDGTPLIRLTCCGTEFCCGADIRVRTTARDGEEPITQVVKFYSDESMDQGAEGMVFTRATLLSKFRWHPYIYYYYTNSDSYNILLGVLGDVTNASTMDKKTCEQIHRVALCSLLYNPNMGNFLRG